MKTIHIFETRKANNEKTQDSYNLATRNSQLATCSSLIPLLVLLFTSVSSAMDVVTIKSDDSEKTIEGEIIVNAKDGGIVIRDAMNFLYPVTPDNIVSKTSDDRPFAYSTASEIKEKMLKELPSGFKVFESKHYLIFYDTSEAFAQWTMRLFEDLHRVFHNFWTKNGMKLKESSTPLIAIIFADSKEYVRFCKEELGDAGDAIIAYYSMQSNRINLFDLTGADDLNKNVPRRVPNLTKIKYLLSQPEAAQMVSTIVHEATHQLAYNSGMQVRYADMPRWLSEGIAMFFETPNLKTSEGWGSLGKDNVYRLRFIMQRLPRRNPEAIKMMITDDSLFTNLDVSLEAYAEAWGLTWLLIKRNPKKFVEYLKIMSEKTPFVYDTPEERLEEFEKCFGSWVEINRAFVNVMKSKRLPR